jgi:hypothetical protein
VVFPQRCDRQDVAGVDGEPQNGSRFVNWRQATQTTVAS